MAVGPLTPNFWRLWVQINIENYKIRQNLRNVNHCLEMPTMSATSYF